MADYTETNQLLVNKFYGTPHVGLANSRPTVHFRTSHLNRMKLAFICCLNDDHSDYFDILVVDEGKVISSSFTLPFLFRADSRQVFFHHNSIQGFDVFHLVHERDASEGGRIYTRKDYEKITENTTSVMQRVISLGSQGLEAEADEYIRDLMENESGREEDARCGLPFYILDRDRSSSLYLTAPRPVHHDWEGLNAFLEEYH